MVSDTICTPWHGGGPVRTVSPMDVTDIAMGAAGIKAGTVQAEFALGVMRKALDAQESTAVQLIEAMPKPPPPAGSSFQVWA